MSAWLINQAGKQFDTPQEVRATDITLPTKPILESSSTYIFTTLTAWLINQAGKQFDTPQEVCASDITLPTKPILESSSTSSPPWVPGLSIKQANSLTPHKR